MFNMCCLILPYEKDVLFHLLDETTAHVPQIPIGTKEA